MSSPEEMSSSVSDPFADYTFSSAEDHSEGIGNCGVQLQQHSHSQHYNSSNKVPSQRDPQLHYLQSNPLHNRFYAEHSLSYQQEGKMHLPGKFANLPSRALYIYVRLQAAARTRSPQRRSWSLARDKTCRSTATTSFTTTVS